MSKFVRAVEESIRSKRLLQRGRSILVAVSGGVDSMVLLHALSRLARQNAWRLVVAHFNHRLRGRASQADEALVKRRVKSLGLQFVSERADVRQFARDHKLSIEMAARQLRHDFFARTCSRLGLRTVALAHHADDQVELFFLRLLRGAGGEGLAGMDWIGPSPSDPEIELVRPLLNVWKEDLRAYAAREKIEFREDATNTQVEHLRNRIRHQLVPWLRAKFQPALPKLILRTMEISGAESEFVSETARAWKQKPNAPAFGELHAAVQRRILQRELVHLGIAPEFDLIERLRRSAGEVIMVNPGLGIWRDEQGEVRSRCVSHVDFNSTGTLLDISVQQGWVAFDGLKIVWQIRPCGKAISRLAKPLRNLEHFDARKVGSPIVLRHWRPGDRFQPIGMRCAVKVQDLFTNAKIPREQRHELVLAATVRDEIFWIEGLRISERFKISGRTDSSLNWQWRRG